MNFMAYIIFLAILVSCGEKSTNEKNSLLVDKNTVIVLSELMVSNTSSGIVGLVDQQLGNLEQGVTSIRQDVLIRNTTSSAVVFNVSANDSLVTLNKTSCPADPNRSCTFQITVKAGQTLGQQISSITINGQSLNYILNVIPKVVPLPALSYPNPMDVGSTQSAAISFSFPVSNQSASTLSYIIDSTQTDSQFLVSSNCPSVERTRSCQVNVTFTPNQPLVAGPVNSTFKLNGVTMSVKATVLPPSTQTIIPSPVNPLDFGDIEQGKSRTLDISVNNNTKLDDLGPIVVTGVSNFSNPVITCPSSWLRKRTCKITLTFNATGKNVQEYLETLTLKGSKIQLDLNLRANVILPSGVVACSLLNAASYGVNLNNVATVSGNIPLCQVTACTDSNLYEVSPDQLSCIDKAIPCQLADVQANGWNTANQLTISGMKIGSDVSQCVIQSCFTNYSVNSSLKSCEADACTMLNASSFGVNLLNVDSVSGTTPNCIVSTCSNPSFYEVSPDQKSCVDKPLDCTLADAQSNGWNITNAQTPTGTKVGTNLTQCAVSTCNTNFELNTTNKTCDAIACTLANSQGNGVTSILNVATVVGTLPNCSVSSCNANYKPAVDHLSCVAKLCNELNAGELSTIGFNTTNATISGTYPSCTLSCNSALQQLAGDGKSCVDKTPTGSISFVQNYTKDLTGNLLNITQTNAQQIQFYSNSSCTTTVGSLFSMPLAQTSITVSSGDGTKNIYAKLINGSASSACLSDNIILDQTNPVLAISAPTGNPTIITTTTTVSGTCSDVTSGFGTNLTISIDSVASSSQTVACSSGTFSLTYTLPGTLVNGTQYTFRVTGTDRAGNQNSNIATFVKNIGRTFTLTKNGNGSVVSTPSGINCGTTCSSTFVNGTSLSLSATPTIGNKISSWSGSCLSAGTSPTCNIASITSNLSATINFAIKNCTDTMLASELTAMGINTSNSTGVLTGATYPSCTLASCNSGYYNSGTSCIQQICTPNSTISCTISNGTANQTCNSQGTAYGVCTAQACNSGYFIENNACVLIYFNTSSGFDSTVKKIVRYDSQSLLVGGSFSSYKGTPQGRITKINSGTGVIDSSFDSGTGFSNSGGVGIAAGGDVSSIKVLSNGQILVGGSILYYDGTLINNLVKLNIDGTIDTLFNLSWQNTVTSRNFQRYDTGNNKMIQDIEVQSDGKILLFGNFRYEVGSDPIAAYNRKVGVIRLNSDGTFDPSFSIAYAQQNQANSLSELLYNLIDNGLVLSNGKILVTTSMQIGASYYDGVFRLNSDGSRDTSFPLYNYSLASPISGLELQSDGKIIVSGGIASINGTVRRGIARLNSDGTVDVGFNAGFTVNQGFGMAIQSDGKILFAGGGSNGVTRINSDGTIDYTFSVGTFNDPVASILPNSDGTMFIGGGFTSFNSTAIYRIIKLNSVGAKTQ